MSKQKGFAVISGSNTVVAKIMENGTVVFGQGVPVDMRISGSLVLDLQGQTGGTGKVIHVDSAGSASFANVDASTVLTTGGGNVQSVLNSLSSSLSSETSSRESGDASLATKIGVDVAAAVSALVDGAPDLLNTLNELAAAIGDDANYATTVTNAVGSINTKVDSVNTALSNSISSEASRATAAEGSLATAFASADTSLDTKLSGQISSEASRATAAEDSLASELSSETSRATSAESSLNTALSSEISRATSSESSLDSRVDDHDVIFSVKKDVAYNDNALVYADAASGTIDQRAGSHDIRDGWAFKNSVAGQKINWYFMNGSPADSLADNVTLSQMTGAFAVVTMDSTTSKPFFAMYTVPQGTGDVIPGFARSRIVYSNTSTPVTAGKKYLVHFGADPKVHPELERIPLTISAGSSGGPQLTSERVLTIALGTNSAAAVNTVNFVAESVGFMSDVVNREVILKIRTATQSDLSVETAARVSGDASLSARIDSLDSGASADLTSLEARLSVEESRAASSEGSLASAFASADTSLDTKLSTSISSEASTARAAETSLASRIDNVLSNVDPAALDSLTEIVDAFVSADGDLNGAITSLASERVSADASLASDISSEASRAQSAESSLNTKVGSVQTVLSNSISSEASRATAAEGSLATAFASADTSLDNKLSSSISTEVSRATSVEDSLASSISTETSRATAAEDSLTTSISTSVSTANASLTSALSIETSSRLSGDTSLDGRLDTVESVIEAVLIVGTAGEIKVGTGAGNETGSAVLSGTITIGLPDDVTVAGNLTVNGNATLGNAVSDTVTVAGKFRVGKMTRSEANIQFSLGNSSDYNGHMFYLNDEDGVDGDVFAEGQKWYFCEDGVWFASPFYAV